MKYERIKCDICEKENLEEEKNCVHLEIPVHKGLDGVETATEYENYDLCVDCIESFFKYKLFKINSFETNKQICDMLEAMKRGKKTG